MNRFDVFAGIALLCLWGCPRTPETPDASTDAGAPIADAEPGQHEPFDAPGSTYRVPACAAACANLKRQGCPEAERQPGEDTCYVVCRKAQETGKIDFKPQCIADAKSIEAVKACGTYRCKR